MSTLFDLMAYGYLDRHDVLWRLGEAWEANALLSRMGRPMPLSQTAMPRQTHPAACTESVVVGSCRQSVNVMKCAPGLATRRACSTGHGHDASRPRWRCNAITGASPTSEGHDRL